MFGLLKNKISSFISGITQRAEQKIEEEAPKQEQERKPSEEDKTRVEEERKKEKQDAERQQREKETAQKEEKERREKEEKKRKELEEKKRAEKEREEKARREKERKEREKREAEEKKREGAERKKNEEARKKEEARKHKEALAKAKSAEERKKLEAEKKKQEEAEKKRQETEETERREKEAIEKKRREKEAAETARLEEEEKERQKQEAEEKRKAAEDAREQERLEAEKKAQQEKLEQERVAEQRAAEEKKQAEKKGGFFGGLFSKAGSILGKKEEEKKEETKPSPAPVQVLKKEEEKSAHIHSTSHKPKEAVHKPDVSASAAEETTPQKKDSGMRLNLSLESKLRGFLFNEIVIKEKDVDDLLENLEFSLLEADVAYEVSQSLIDDLKNRIVGKKVSKASVGDEVKKAIFESLVSIMDGPKPDFWGIIRTHEKPVKILFVGPNGAGKTTTMAKLAKLLQDQGFTCVFSASDTFRAAAIEQTSHHAEKLGVPAIKHQYGADPAAVAFDAVNHAKSKKLDVVLIDSAGRQDTNKNLIDELKKIERIVKPDLKLFIGESISGNAIVDQVRAFHEAVVLDAVILTKLDCDAKGGTAISISKATGVPILFLGIGQAYTDLIEFDARKVAEQILT